MDEKDAARLLAALSQPARLRLFRALVVVGQAGLSPSTMAEGLGIAASSLSFHLKELLHADLVTQERVGRGLIYRANFPRMNSLLSFLTDNCCQGAACGLDAAGCAPERAGHDGSR